ncbi:MAG: NAD-dependent epimerase/dehydratase family protein [Chloroflexi bacterium]|nr:MAG: NAD-dependent epimerase/dehydratase family protein [Chloroflexota bacterium]
MPDPNSVRVAVTGGAGFIGSHTVEMLVAAKAKVLVIDDNSHPCGEPLPHEAEIVSADCGSEAAAKALIAFKPDVVLHLASKGGVQRAARDPGEHVKISLASTVGLFDAAVRAGAGRIVTASSGGTIYGEGAKLPAREIHKPAPLSAYGAAKRSEEIYMAALGLRHGISTLALRYGNVYGPRQDGTGEAGVIAITCYRLLERAAPRVFGDGGQTRDFIYVTDAAAANVAAVFGRVTGETNIGTGRETSINAVVKRLVAESGRHTKSEFVPAREFEVRRVCLNPARAHRYLHWKARVSINAGLAATWSWFRKRHSAQRAAPLGLP